MSYMLQRIAELEAENKELRAGIKSAEDMLDYERNKYERLLVQADSDIAEKIRHWIGLELEGIRDVAAHVPENDSRRIIRRLDRIERYLSEILDGEAMA